MLTRIFLVDTFPVVAFKILRNPHEDVLPSTLDSSALGGAWQPDRLWRNGVLMQVSGYVLAGLAFLGLTFSLRKRWRRLARFDYARWRLFHGVLGIAGLAVLVAHTGLHLGTGLNRWLMLSYLGLCLLGGCTGLMIALRAAGRAARLCESLSAVQTTHAGFLWTLLVLLGFHIFAVYYY